MRTTKLFAILLLSLAIAVPAHDEKTTALARINRFPTSSHESQLPGAALEPAAIARSLDELYTHPAPLERAWNLQVNENAS